MTAPKSGGMLRKVARFTLGALAALWVGAVFVATALGQPHPPPAQPKDHLPPSLPMPGHPPPPRPGGLQPGLPPGHPPPGGRLQPHPLPKRTPPPASPPPQHAPAEHHEEHEGGGHHYCPGHGPTDPISPREINLWHGMLMANNAQAEAGGFFNHLLFRYENEKNACDPKNEPPPFLASVLNFGILLYVVGRFGKKPLAEALVRRRNTIMAEIDTATRIREEAEARLVDYEEKFDTIHEALDAARKDLTDQAEAERKHLIAEAEERRARTRRDAEFLVEQERKAARQMLLQESIEAAVAHAHKLLVERMTSADREKMAEQYLGSVGKAIGQASRTRALGQNPPVGGAS